MGAFWTGQRVRLRGIEPEDWSAFMQFDGHAEHQRSVDMIYPPRSAAGYRAWAVEQAGASAAAWGLWRRAGCETTNSSPAGFTTWS